jgi:hypothetical protein
MKLISIIFATLDLIFDLLVITIKVIKPYAKRLYVTALRPQLLRLVQWSIKQGFITLARPTGFIPFIG